MLITTALRTRSRKTRVQRYEKNSLSTNYEQNIYHRFKQNSLV